MKKLSFAVAAVVVAISLSIITFQNKYISSESEYVEATGTIIAVTANPANGPKRFRQVTVEFTTDTGELVTFTKALYSRKLGYAPDPVYPGMGDAVEVLYDKNNPSDATMRPHYYWTWFVFGVIVVLIGGFYFSRKWKKFIQDRSPRISKL